MPFSQRWTTRECVYLFTLIYSVFCSCDLDLDALLIYELDLYQYILISFTYKIRTTRQPSYLHNLISLQTDNNTRSSDVVTLARPSPASSLKITDRSFQYASPHLWNKLPFSLREPVSPLCAYLNPSFSSPLSPSITPSLFHSYSELTFSVNPFCHRSLTIDTPTDFLGWDLRLSVLVHRSSCDVLN